MSVARRVALKSTLLALGIALSLAFPALALGQDKPVLVLVVDEARLSESEAQILEDGICNVIEDFGGFLPLGQSELEREAQSRLEACDGDPGCLSLQLEPGALLLIVRVVAEDDTFRAEVTPVAAGVEDVPPGSQVGNLPGPEGADFLLAPIYEALEGLANVDTGTGEPEVVAEPTEQPPDVHVTREPPPETSEGPALLADLPPTLSSGEDRTLQNATWIGGSALLAAGLSFWLLADDAQIEIQESEHSQADLLSLQDDGETYASVGNAFVITGLVGIAAGFVLEWMGE